MNSIASSLPRDCTNSLGIPVDNLTLAEAVDGVVRIANRRDGTAQLVSTLNVDFLVNALGYAYSKPRHPELLHILRDSRLVTADGFPIVWLSRIMGKPVQERVAGSDLVPALARRIANEDLSLFLLGGGEGAADAAARTLVEQNPGLDIAGTAAPFIQVEGPEIAEFAAADTKLVEMINASGADILLLGLGNPKQELWFNRNRDKLTVPVCIGVGGTFDFINGNVKRAPAILQTLNMEWLFRITQDPKRLVGRYGKGLIKFGLMAAPLIYYRMKETLLYSPSSTPSLAAPQWKSVWSSRSESLEVVQLPRIVSPEYLENLVDQLQQSAVGATTRLLDFSQVRHITAAGHQELFRLADLLRSPLTNISVLGMQRSVARHLRASRVLDLLENNRYEGNTLNAISFMPQAENAQEIGCQSYVMSETTLIFLSGVVNGDGLASLGLIECMEHAARDRTCILDLRNVTRLETTAIAELQALVTSILTKGSGAIMVSGAGEQVMQMFRMTGLSDTLIAINEATLLAFISAEGVSHDG